MKILMVNGNTSEDVTNKLAAEAWASASDGTEIITATAEFGASIIGSRRDNAIAQHAVLDLVSRHSADADAILIAVSLDTALGAVREVASVPVVGMTEAGLLTACMLGDRLGLITFDRQLAPVYEALIASYGLMGRVAGTQIIEAAVSSAATDSQDSRDAAIRSAAEVLIDRDRVEVIVALGAVAAGVPRRIKNELQVPILDGITCGVLQAELLVRLGPRKPQVGSYAMPSIFARPDE